MKTKKETMMIQLNDQIDRDAEEILEAQKREGKLKVELQKKV